MRVVERPSLQGMNSFGVAASAALLLTVETEEDVLALPAFDPRRDLVLGDGSNVVLATDVPGAVFHNGIRGRAIVDRDGSRALVEAGAGENWNRLVQWSLEQGLSGLENLSLIPGRAGAAPIQNIGAYGVELSSMLESVTAWDWHRATWTSLPAADCRLAYRDSLFKSGCPDRYFITSIRLTLDCRFNPQLDYPGLREELACSGIRRPSARDVSQAVMRIRRRKLPDPAVSGNAGSFFRNPVVDADQAGQLESEHPELPLWPLDDGRFKLSAAWLIERCGLKGLRTGDAAVSEKHALVLVNLGSARGADIVRLADTVRSTVAEKFDVDLEIEPRVVAFAP